ncbi:MAG: hypothetical protein U1A78_17260 [Polyangia bacterium]
MDGSRAARRNVALLLAPAALGLVASCAAMKTAYLETYCNYDSAYELGHKTAYEIAEGKRSASPASILQECPESSREAALRGYREGLTNGGRSSAVVVMQQAPRYRCTVSVFANTFEGAGPTQAAAEQTARDTCAARYHAMHCDRVECRELP